LTYSPLSSAFEGFRLILRRPVSFLAWCAVFGAVAFALHLAATGLSKVTLPFASRFGGGQASWALMVTSLSVVLHLVASTFVACAVCRAVLRPEARAIAYLRFGMDELRLLWIWALLAAALVLSVVLAALGYSALEPVLGAGMGLPIVWAVAFGLLLAASAPGARLSLAAPITVMDGRGGITGSWALTRRRFWSLLGMWVIVVLVDCLLGLIVEAVGAPFGGRRSTLAMLGVHLKRAAHGPVGDTFVMAVTALGTTVEVVLGAGAAAAVYAGLAPRRDAAIEAFE
jgi:hypothetical protein